MAMSAYTLAPGDQFPRTVPETNSEKTQVFNLYRQAGIEPPERPAVHRLVGNWRKHRSGAFVVVEGWKVFVFDR